MASAILSYLQDLWLFSILKTDDLKVSTRLVRSLAIPEQTKQFVYAVREPDSHAVVYILAAQNLSEQSAQDAEYLIKEVQPKAVVAQVTPSALAEIRTEEKSLGEDQVNEVPTSAFGVLRRCLTDKINKEQYDTFAGSQVLHEIFGIGFYGHFLAAKRVAVEVGSNFLLLESPYESPCTVHPPSKATSGDPSSGLHVQPTCLLPMRITPALNSNSWRLCISDTLQSQAVKSLSPSLHLLTSKGGSSDSISEPEPRSNYEAPPFAKSVYPLLEDLRDIFNDLPAIGKALVSAQKMLNDVSEGETVDTHILSVVHNFRIAVEAMRIALNNAGRYPVDKMENGVSTRLNFSELPSEEKRHVLFAQALRSQARKFGSVVAIVDAGSLAGLRRHWNTTVPTEVADLADLSSTSFCDGYLDADGDNVKDNTERKRLLSNKPVVAVGAGATAVLGASSLSKAIPASTFVKLGLAHLQRTAAIGLGKILGPSKLLAPKVASLGAKTSPLKLAASAERIRAVTHSMMASAKRTSLLAVRTSFYGIMRKRHAQPVRLAPWATFGCSVAACTGLLAYGDGIECAAESIPSVPMIASLGRGLQSLHRASLEVERTNGRKMQEALQTLMYNLKKNK